LEVVGDLSSEVAEKELALPVRSRSGRVIDPLVALRVYGSECIAKKISETKLETEATIPGYRIPDAAITMVHSMDRGHIHKLLSQLIEEDGNPIIYRNERQFFERFKEALMCLLCRKLVENPVVLTCGHFACWDCIQAQVFYKDWNEEKCPYHCEVDFTIAEIEVARPDVWKQFKEENNVCYLLQEFIGLFVEGCGPQRPFVKREVREVSDDDGAPKKKARLS